ncbi:MAG: site-specific DNA-methyltransferase [Pseudonocardiaceae bacterium]
MPPRMKPDDPTPVESVTHTDKRRNIPTADAMDFVSDRALRVEQVRYPRDPTLDPQLVWKGKDAADRDDLVADAPPIYIQEKIDPRVLVENLRRTASSPADEPELTLFDDFDGLDPLDKVDFYSHAANWSNRMILGDSLQVMASLAEKEDLRGQVQMIYLDPPYGIKFGSNWQVSTRKRDVKDGKLEDATREVEQIKAFRDTWELGIHSYLSYLRDRLMAARDLLTEGGSIFVQIGDENVHLVRSLLDEVFGSENFVSLISFVTTSGFDAATLARAGDYLLWYARDAAEVKARQLWRSNDKMASSGYRWIMLPDGSCRGLTTDELAGATALPSEARLYTPDNFQSQNPASEDQAFIYQGKIYRPGPASHWKASYPDGMNRLARAGRIHVARNSIRYIRFATDFPLRPYNNLWTDTGTGNFTDDKTYVVQSNTKVIERCLLMTTDTGDLVLDPTCGSGTTAYVAEQCGRRWITIDTSRVAIALARQRLMGAKLPYYLLADSPDGRRKEQELTGQPPPTTPTADDVRKGFVYQRVPHVTLKSIANNPDVQEGMSREEIDAAIARHADIELLYDRPYEDTKKIRVAGRFTVESVSPHRTSRFETEVPASEREGEHSDEEAYLRTVHENLLAAGAQNGRKAERLLFESLTPFGDPYIQFEGTRRGGGNGTPQRVAVCVGPQYGTVNATWVKDAARAALRGGNDFDVLLICGFGFDAHSSETVNEFAPINGGDFATVQDERQLGRLPVLLVRMNAELAMGDAVLKKTGTANLFTIFGEPDVRIRRTEEGVVVELMGVDVYDPTTGIIRSNDTSEIALWMIDSDYDEESFFVRHCYFSGGGTDPYARLKRALRAEIDEQAWNSLYGTRSRPFPLPKSGKIAVKVINHYGDEVLKVFEVEK